MRIQAQYFYLGYLKKTLKFLLNFIAVTAEKILWALEFFQILMTVAQIMIL